MYFIPGCPFNQSNDIRVQQRFPASERDVRNAEGGHFIYRQQRFFRIGENLGGLLPDIAKRAFSDASIGKREFRTTDFTG
jgi:hypothetical protein